MKTLSTPQAAGHEGQIDAVEDGRLLGWAWSPAEPARPVDIEICYDGERIGLATADVYREDLERRRIGDGKHGFVFELPPELADRPLAGFSMRLPGTHAPLAAPRPPAAAPQSPAAQPAPAAPPDQMEPRLMRLEGAILALQKSLRALQEQPQAGRRPQSAPQPAPQPMHQPAPETAAAPAERPRIDAGRMIERFAAISEERHDILFKQLEETTRAVYRLEVVAQRMEGQLKQLASDREQAEERARRGAREQRRLATIVVVAFLLLGVVQLLDLLIPYGGAGLDFLSREIGPGLRSWFGR